MPIFHNVVANINELRKTTFKTKLMNPLIRTLVVIYVDVSYFLRLMVILECTGRASVPSASSWTRQRLRLRRLLLPCAAALLMCSSSPCAANRHAGTVDILEPGLDWWKPGVEYARIIQLVHGPDSNATTLLATCEKSHLDNGLPTLSFPIFRSADLGATWTRISDVTTAAAGGMRWEPTLFELPRRLGPHEAGTVLCAGLSIDQTAGSFVGGVLKLFASGDAGRSWSFVSNITRGGPQADHGVWEPFLLVNPAGQLMVFYRWKGGACVHVCVDLYICMYACVCVCVGGWVGVYCA